MSFTASALLRTMDMMASRSPGATLELTLLVLLIALVLIAVITFVT